MAPWIVLNTKLSANVPKKKLADECIRQPGEIIKYADTQSPAF
jgi:hypothetical protein